jgi:hypothetical protein
MNQAYESNVRIKQADRTRGSAWPTMLVGCTCDQENLGGRSRPAGMKSPPRMPRAVKQDSDIAWLAAGASIEGGALAPTQQAAQALHAAWCAVAASDVSSILSDGQCDGAA